MLAWAAGGLFQLDLAMASPPATAPGAPGKPSFWSYSGKTGIGTSYEVYADPAHPGRNLTGAVSRVWFSLAQGMVTEVIYGLIHEAQVRNMRFVVAGDGIVDGEAADMTTTTDYLVRDAAGRPLAPAYVLQSKPKDPRRSGQYTLTKTILTDPDRQVLLVKVHFETKNPHLRLHVLLEPHMANTAPGDQAAASPSLLSAHEGSTYLALRASALFDKASAGFVGVSDGDADLADNGVMDWSYATTGTEPGHVILTGRFPAGKKRDFVLALGFGGSEAAARGEADGALKAGFADATRRYVGRGKAVGWEDYLAALEHLPLLQAQATDGGALVNVSAMVLKIQEDKTYPGALIASLSNPWGDTANAEKPATGYKAVWPRDFYQCAMALLALGDTTTAKAAFRYLPKVQVTPQTPGNKGASGWFLQKTHVDGEQEWISVQLDQTAMPIMLGWKLWHLGVLDDQTMVQAYEDFLKPAADFLAHGGHVSLSWNDAVITPPLTQQERWEEQGGYSPSTTAAVIAGLVTAADLANLAGDTESSATYLQAADDDAQHIESRMFTTNGTFQGGDMDGRYFVRITRNDDPNDHGLIGENNGRPALPEDHVLDAGFLELVRYGVRRADAPSITESLPELDSFMLPEALRVRYPVVFAGTGPVYGFRRYGNDGYGEDAASGINYSAGGTMRPEQRGRLWPLLTGERGHYQLALDLEKGSLSTQDLEALRTNYVHAMEGFANAGLMLAEQAWDGVGANPRDYAPGDGTNSATPLSWAHAEYIKLLRSLADEAVWDRYPPVASRYAQSMPEPSVRLDGQNARSSPSSSPFNSAFFYPTARPLCGRGE